MRKKNKVALAVERNSCIYDYDWITLRKSLRVDSVISVSSF